MNWVANVVFPAPDAPITTVVECSLKPPSNNGLRPKIPVRIFRTRAHRGGPYKNVLHPKSGGQVKRQGGLARGTPRTRAPRARGRDVRPFEPRVSRPGRRQWMARRPRG